MTVSWNGRQLKGCPLQITVTSAADASRVICSGDGLKHGIVGQEIRSFIDTRRAGPGTSLTFQNILVLTQEYNLTKYRSILR